MTTAHDCPQDDADPDARIRACAGAGSPLPKRRGHDGPRSRFEVLETVGQDGVHGGAFGRETVDAGALDGLPRCSRTGAGSASGARRPVRSASSHALRRRRASTRCATRPRVGPTMLDQGRGGDEQVVPGQAVAAVAGGGDREVAAKPSCDLVPGGICRSMLWDTQDVQDACDARGVHGRTIRNDPAADMVIARFASHPVAADAASDPASLPGQRALAEHLMAGDDLPLLDAEWRIEDIGGRGAIDDGPAGLQALPGGRPAGSAICIPLISIWPRDGGALTITRAGVTIMACPEALAEQETRLLDLLPTAAGYAIDGSRAPILRPSGGGTIAAPRPLRMSSRHAAPRMGRPQAATDIGAADDEHAVPPAAGRVVGPGGRRCAAAGRGAGSSRAAAALGQLVGDGVRHRRPDVGAGLRPDGRGRRGGRDRRGGGRHRDRGGALCARQRRAATQAVRSRAVRRRRRGPGGDVAGDRCATACPRARSSASRCRTARAWRWSPCRRSSPRTCRWDRRARRR